MRAFDSITLQKSTMPKIITPFLDSKNALPAHLPQLQTRQPKAQFQKNH